MLASVAEWMVEESSILLSNGWDPAKFVLAAKCECPSTSRCSSILAKSFSNPLIGTMPLSPPLANGEHDAAASYVSLLPCGGLLYPSTSYANALAWARPVWAVVRLIRLEKTALISPVGARHMVVRLGAHDIGLVGSRN